MSEESRYPFPPVATGFHSGIDFLVQDLVSKWRRKVLSFLPWRIIVETGMLLPQGKAVHEATWGGNMGTDYEIHP